MRLIYFTYKDHSNYPIVITFYVLPDKVTAFLLFRGIIYKMGIWKRENYRSQKVSFRDLIMHGPVSVLFSFSRPWDPVSLT